MQLSNVLVLNAGSSTVKFACYRELNRHHHGSVEIGPTDYRTAIERILQALDNQPVDAVAHRVVHGGRAFRAPTRITNTVIQELVATIPLAPLHQGPAIEVMRILMERLPQSKQIACFDTAFHSTLPLTETMFAIPRRFYDHGLHRYGFHGLSYQSIASQLPRYSARAALGHTVVCHLGNGASVCGMRASISQFTTMGLTPLDGLIMGTRSGRLDPSVVLYWLRENLTVSQIENTLNRESGLLGISGTSSDMRTLLATNTPESQQAIEMFCTTVAKEIASAGVVLGGLDTIVFTAGIGENCPSIRSNICRKLGWLSVELDEPANEANATCLNSESSSIEVLRIPTDEQHVMLSIARGLLERETKQ